MKSKYFIRSYTIPFLLNVILFSVNEVVAQGAGPIHTRCPNILSKIIKGNCNRLSCDSIVKEEKCPFDTIYIPDFSLCGCCPKCVRFLTLTDDPSVKRCVRGNDESKVEWSPDPTCVDDNHCPVDINLCSPGLVCDEESGKCEEPKSVPDHETEECMFRKTLKRTTGLWNTQELHHWDPSCESDGSFKPKQCKGSHFSGECYCVNKAGSRIFGRQWRIKSENQTCACSRRVYELRENHLIASLHCSPDGNFEPLQCDTDSGLCYCVDPITGELDGSALPQDKWKLLPCYHVNLTEGHEDGMYLRQCDSQHAAGQAVILKGKHHGTRVDFKRSNCDYDGSFAPVQTFSTISECVFKNGTRIGDNFKPTTTTMNCRCARDIKEYFPSEKVASRLDCEYGTGNYERAYDFGSYVSCVDADGFMYGDVVKSNLICCILDEGCSVKTLRSCYNSDHFLDGIKSCKFWRYRN